VFLFNLRSIGGLCGVREKIGDPIRIYHKFDRKKYKKRPVPIGTGLFLAYL
jgi:hypothetical protein